MYPQTAKVPPSERIPSPTDYQARRCGHNFEPFECPYTPCGFRDALEALQRLDVRHVKVMETIRHIQDTLGDLE